MQVSLTATGGLERRLEVAVPARAGRRRSRSAAQQDLAHRASQGLSPRQGAARGDSPAVRRAGARRGRQATSCGPVRRSRGAREAESGRRPAHRADRVERVQISSTPRCSRCCRKSSSSRSRHQASRSRWRQCTEADVDAMLESCASSVPLFTEVERAARRETDRVTSTSQARDDGVERRQQHDQDVHFVVGAGQVMQEFERPPSRGAASARAAASAVPLPPMPPSQELAGKRAQMHFTIKKVEEQACPLDEEFGAGVRGQRRRHR